MVKEVGDFYFGGEGESSWRASEAVGASHMWEEDEETG